MATEMEYHAKTGEVIQIEATQIQPKAENESLYWVARIYSGGAEIGPHPRPHFTDPEDAIQAAWLEIRKYPA